MYMQDANIKELTVRCPCLCDRIAYVLAQVIQLSVEMKLRHIFIVGETVACRCMTRYYCYA